MEQRIGSSSQPLDAGVNPAHIPGLTAPVAKKPEDAGPEAEDTPGTEETGTPVAEDTGGETSPKASEAEPAEPEKDSEEPEKASGAGSEKDSGAGSEEAEEPASGETPGDGPVFEAADRRARIVADARGVRLTLDDQECEFRWDEIGAVETETGRFGKRYTVTVHTPDRRWYPIEIEARSRAQHKEWDTLLDAALDAYFEE
ncbi:hypothetical protein [Streptomyces sp. NPDC093094]|uniref:hypothetical protein n=1 Tax=Streptomyces sp. NPDC093094 TaxID=3366026 RepID=UPI003809771A